MVAVCASPLTVTNDVAFADASLLLVSVLSLPPHAVASEAESSETNASTCRATR